MKFFKPLPFVLAFCAVAGSAFAKTPLTSPATVFSGPGASWPVIAQIPAGGHVDVINCYGG